MVIPEMTPDAVALIVFAFLLSLSELLPFASITDGNGVLHGISKLFVRLVERYVENVHKTESGKQREYTPPTKD